MVALFFLGVTHVFLDDDRLTRKPQLQEKAYVTGLEAANAVMDELHGEGQGTLMISCMHGLLACCRASIDPCASKPMPPLTIPTLTNDTDTPTTHPTPKQARPARASSRWRPTSRTCRWAARSARCYGRCSATCCPFTTSRCGSWLMEGWTGWGGVCCCTCSG